MFSPNPNPTIPVRAQTFVIAPREFNFQNASFVAATSQYVAAMMSSIESFMDNAAKGQKAQAQESDAFTQLAGTISIQIANQWAEYQAAEDKANSDSGSGLLGYLMDAINIVCGILSEDPGMVAMGIYGIVTQATTGKDPLEEAFEKITGNKILSEFIAGSLEAAGCMAVDFLSTKLIQCICKDATKMVLDDLAEQAEKEAAGQAAKSMGKQAAEDLVEQAGKNGVQEVAEDTAVQTVKKIAEEVKKILLQVISKFISLLRSFLSHVGMTLSMSPFWQDVAAEIPGVSGDGAMWLGLLFTVGFSGLTALTAERSFLKDIIKQGVRNSFKGSAEKVFKIMDGLQTAFILARNGLQIGQSVQTIKEGENLEDAAKILRQVASTQSTFSLLQGITAMFNESMQQTQSTMKSISNGYIAFNQTLPALAHMMDINHLQAV